MTSQKTEVIEYLFNKHWDEIGSRLLKQTMSISDVSGAIIKCNAIYDRKLSANNPANFLKDFLRGAHASENWPTSVTAQRFTAVQRTGDGDVFEFIPFEEGQTEAFPDLFPPRDDAPKFPVQSISMPLVTKILGRVDETWLVQTAINLRVIESHFAIGAKFPLLELAHLQMGIKLRRTEIDALFLGKTGNPKDPESVIITCEAKHYNDRLIPQQIINQVQAAFDATDVSCVIPIGLRAMKNIGFYLTEFEAVRREEADNLVELELAAEAVYELHPSVKGI